MTLREEIVKILIDKGLIAIIVLLVAFKLNQVADLSKSKTNLENEFTNYKRQVKIQILEKQLSDFYWPIYLRLQKDNALWHRIGDLSGSAGDNLPKEISSNIERVYIIKNHNEIVDIINNNIYLSQLPPEGLTVLVKYIQHVAIYNAILLQKERKYNPTDLKEPFPRELFPVIEEKLNSLQLEYNNLINLQKQVESN